jgi:hypothetical protein
MFSRVNIQKSLFKGSFINKNFSKRIRPINDDLLKELGIIEDNNQNKIVKKSEKNQDKQRDSIVEQDTNLAEEMKEINKPKIINEVESI